MIVDPNYNPYDEIEKCQERIVILEDLVDQLIRSNNNQAKLLEDTAHSFAYVSKMALHNDERINNFLENK